MQRRWKFQRELDTDLSLVSGQSLFRRPWTWLPLSATSSIISALLLIILSLNWLTMIPVLNRTERNSLFKSSSGISILGETLSYAALAIPMSLLSRSSSRTTELHGLKPCAIFPTQTSIGKLSQSVETGGCIRVWREGGPAALRVALAEYSLASGRTVLMSTQNSAMPLI